MKKIFIAFVLSLSKLFNGILFTSLYANYRAVVHKFWIAALVAVGQFKNV